MNIAPRLKELLPADVQDLLGLIGRLADREGREVFLVGGMVRDIIMGRGTVDVDIVVNGDGPTFAQALAELTGGSIVVHDRFGTSVLIMPDKRRVDVATARTETYGQAAALPDVTFSVIDYDLQRRDFSVNAIAVALGARDFGAVLDPFDGRADIANKTIRALHDGSFIDDPTRVFRAARFEQRFGFRIDDSTERLLRAAVADGYLKRVSGARVRNEIAALFEESSPAAAVARLQDFGVWGALADGLNAGAEASGIIESIPAAAEELASWLKPDWRRLNAMLMGLTVSAGPGVARALSELLGLSRQGQRAIVKAVTGYADTQTILQGNPPPSEMGAALSGFSDEALVFFYAAGDATSRANIGRFLASRQIKPLINGRDLVRLGYSPSAAFNEVLQRVWAAQLDGEVKTAAAARALAKHLLDSTKLHD